MVIQCLLELTMEGSLAESSLQAALAHRAESTHKLLDLKNYGIGDVYIRLRRRLT